MTRTNLGRTQPFSSSKRLVALGMSTKVGNHCLPRHPRGDLLALKEKGGKVSYVENYHPLCLVGCSEGRLQDTTEGEDPPRSGGIELEMIITGLGN